MVLCRIIFVSSSSFWTFIIGSASTGFWNFFRWTSKGPANPATYLLSVHWLLGTCAVKSSSIFVKSVWATRLGYSWSETQRPTSESERTYAWHIYSPSLTDCRSPEKWYVKHIIFWCKETNHKIIVFWMHNKEFYVPIVVLSVNILDVKDMNSCMEDLWKYPKEAKS